MHDNDNDNPFTKQKPIYKKHNGFNKIIHAHVPRKIEG